jgi:hypothetical protein
MAGQVTRLNNPYYVQAMNELDRLKEQVEWMEQDDEEQARRDFAELYGITRRKSK